MLKKYLSGSLIAILLISIVMISSCEYEFIEPEKVVIPEFISFADDVLPIFSSSCSLSGCHVAGNPILDLSATNAFAQLYAKGLIDLDLPEQSKLYFKLIDGNGTHKGRSTAADQAKILEWIKKGGRNN